MALSIERREKGDPFEEYPQLMGIWPMPYLGIAREAVRDDLKDISQGASWLGGIFLIKDGADVIGITGYFPFGQDGTAVGLRWHGVVPDRRGSGVSGRVLGMVVAQAHADFPQASELVELIPANDYGKPLERHFASLGFKPTGPLETYDWADNAWQPYRLDIAAFLATARPKIGGMGNSPAPTRGFRS